jgi:hypothetical protein
VRERLLRVVLVLLAVPGAVVGLWAAFAPRSFYDDFPGGGRSWVAPDGPFNEHLVRDVGALNLALVVLTVAAALVLTRTLVVVAALGWLVYGVPHLVYHARHLDPFERGDQVGIVTSLVLAPALAVVALLLGAKMPASATAPRSSASSTSA